MAADVGNTREGGSDVFEQGAETHSFAFFVLHFTPMNFFSRDAL